MRQLACSVTRSPSTSFFPIPIVCLSHCLSSFILTIANETPGMPHSSWSALRYCRVVSCIIRSPVRWTPGIPALPASVVDGMLGTVESRIFELKRYDQLCDLTERTHKISSHRPANRHRSTLLYTRPFPIVLPPILKWRLPFKIPFKR